MGEKLATGVGWIKICPLCVASGGGCTYGMGVANGGAACVGGYCIDAGGGTYCVGANDVGRGVYGMGATGGLGVGCFGVAGVETRRFAAALVAQDALTCSNSCS